MDDKTKSAGSSSERPRKSARKKPTLPSMVGTQFGYVHFDTLKAILSVAASADQLQRFLAEQGTEIVGQFYSEGGAWARLASYGELKAVLSIGNGKEDLNGLFARCEFIRAACEKPGRDLSVLSSLPHISTAAAMSFVEGVQEAYCELDPSWLADFTVAQ